MKGTLNVLRSCTKVPSLKRVVLTASMASVSFNRRPLTPDVVIDETWFSDPIFCAESKVCFYFSKLFFLGMYLLGVSTMVSTHFCLMYICVVKEKLSSHFTVM